MKEGVVGEELQYLTVVVDDEDERARQEQIRDSPRNEGPLTQSPTN